MSKLRPPVLNDLTVRRQEKVSTIIASTQDGRLRKRGVKRRTNHTYLWGQGEGEVKCMEVERKKSQPALDG